MEIFSRAILIIVLCIPLYCSAAEGGAVNNTTSIPDGFGDIKLLQKFPDSVAKKSTIINSSNGVVYLPLGDGSVEKDLASHLSGNEYVVVDGKVVSMCFSVSGNDVFFFDYLVEKFGYPAVQCAKRFRSHDGRIPLGMSMRWIGDGRVMSYSASELNAFSDFCISKIGFLQQKDESAYKASNISVECEKYDQPN